jgi:hypothetical protein
MHIIKSGRMRWTGHAAHMGEKGNTYRVFMVKFLVVASPLCV